MASAQERHVPLSVIEDYLSQGLDGVLGIEGKPSARLVIESANRLLAVRFPADDVLPDVTAFANLRSDLVKDEGTTWHQISVQLEDNVDEVYAMLCTLVDRVQLLGTPFAIAVRDVLESLSEILAVRTALSKEKQVGMAGELLTLLALSGDIGSEQAIATWRGPFAEEHDFGLIGQDVEVKVTLNERRQHWISSVTQLVPTGDRPLYLLSIQLTSAGTGPGWSLPSLVARVRALKGMSGEVFDAGLASVGYRKRDADLYRSRWSLRSPPAFFLVDSAFPSVTRPALEKVVPASYRVLEVRYRIDLTELPSAPALFSFESLGNDGDDG
jgi:hypothetical protein